MSNPWKPGIVSIAVAGSLVFLAACETTTASRTERSVSRDPVTDQVVVEEQTTVTEQEVDTCDGIVSCTVDFAGDVIAFPFRLIGGLFKVIF